MLRYKTMEVCFLHRIKNGTATFYVTVMSVSRNADFFPKGEKKSPKCEIKCFNYLFLIIIIIILFYGRNRLS